MHMAFGVREALSFGWREFKKNPWFLVLFTLAFLSVTALFGGMGDKNPSIIGQFVSTLISLFSTLTFARVGLSALKGKPFSWKEAFEIDWNVFGIYILASILFVITYAVGFVFLIIPGVIAIVRLSFFGFLVLEGEPSPVKALQRSWALTRNHFWRLLGFGLILGLVDVAGLLALGVGVLVTTPVTMLALAYAYDRLKTA